jgi:hypothetical protein
MKHFPDDDPVGSKQITMYIMRICCIDGCRDRQRNLTFLLVILRPTVSRSIRLGAVPLLEQVT